MTTLTAAGIEPLFRLLGRYMPLEEADRAALMALETGPLVVSDARTDIAREGENPSVVRLLVSGWACRYKDLPDGRRQIVGFFLPGDFCDLNIYILKELDHSIGALTAVRYFEIQPRQFQEVIDDRPQLLRALLWHEMVTSGIQREWLLSIGQRSPLERLAHLFVELYYRLSAVGLATGLSFDFPITQNHLAEANGLSLVHLIRVNGVAPGPIWTPLNPFGGASEEKLKTFGQNVPMGRPGQPNEVAPSFLFLACEDSSYMSGQVLHPNGGTIVGS